MPAFGRYRCFPRRFGGGASVFEQEHMAMLDALAPGWDVADDTELFCQTYAEALALAAIWAFNRRLQNSRVPARMTETLRTWEQACGLRPLATDSAQTRRAAVAAKMLGYAGNAISQIDDVCSELAGSAYAGLVFADTAQEVTYWPGINPGPPGFEWTSNRALVAVALTAASFPTQADLLNMIRKIRVALNALIPSWMGFEVGTDDGGFVVSVGTVGQTLLGGP